MATLTQPGPLTGFTVGVTAARRREELVALLTRRGAQVVEAPVLRIMPLADDLALREATERCLAAPLDYVVATTGVGWRGWMSAAEGWGRGAALAEACRSAVVLSRGPKATGAVRASGLGEGFSPGSEATDELLTWLLARPLAGRRIAVQEHGVRLDAFAAALRERGAEVISVPVYRWAPPDDMAPVRRLVEQTVRRQVHALTFTSAPAVTAFIATADAEGLREPLLDALRADVLPVCVGTLCARPFAELGLPTVFPERGRLGSLVRLLAETLPTLGRRELSLSGTVLTLQGNAALVDGESHWLSPRGAAVLRALAERPGRVLSRAELLRAAWADASADEHAVEAAVGRLRAALGPHAGLIRTVPKRGYRLAAG
ncbi:uroporphyrinogen-III synthase [Kitasatospora aureofaciens]|uniref:uroporphyrinogen-III synthase n=1 Tax=Kitasatospora aureofaciens TaxID=1894 RepID=UPI001C467B5C|nr:uroporphyrinogen-III synthase [Kitasatospora aureofaciens]MBV6695818.1 uroporphyrinogen-III synthase [Kitasatospora aureofaciens]